MNHSECATNNSHLRPRDYMTLTGAQPMTNLILWLVSHNQHVCIRTSYGQCTSHNANYTNPCPLQKNFLMIVKLDSDQTNQMDVDWSLVHQKPPHACNTDNLHKKRNERVLALWFVETLRLPGRLAPPQRSAKSDNFATNHRQTFEFATAEQLLEEDALLKAGHH